MIKILVLTLIFVIISLVEVSGLVRQKKIKEVILFFVFLIVGYILNLLYLLNIQITPTNKIIQSLLKPIEKFWGQ